MDLTSKLIEATKISVHRYAKMSQSKNLVVPECWLQCKIADQLSELAEISIVVEASRTQYGWDSEIQYPFPSDAKGRFGRPDLLIFDGESKHVVEIKGPRTTWSSFTSDAERVRQFVEDHGFSTGTLIYASRAMTLKELDQEEKFFSKWCNENDIRTTGPLIQPYRPNASERWQILWFTKQAKR